MTTRLSSLAFLLGLGLAGCFNPTIENGKLQCQESIGCPSGYTCAVNGFCYKTSDLTSLDLSIGPFRGNGGLGELVLSGAGTVTLNTDNGEIKIEGMPTPLLPANAPGFDRTVQSNGEPVSIWNFTRFVVPRSMVVKPTESSTVAVLALVATDEISIDGTLLLDGYGGYGGFPATAGFGLPGQGGGGAPADVSGPGGGGGGLATAGMKGGGTLGGMAGGAVGKAATGPLYIGSGGGGGSGMNQTNGGGGGKGGGAVLLLAQRIHVGGSISVNGKNGSTGRPDTTATGGGGGGSGGTIVIAADEVDFTAGGVGDGGTGGGGGDGGVGGTGSVSLSSKGGEGGRGGLNGSGTSNGGFAGGRGSDGRIIIGSKSRTGMPLSTPPATSLTEAMGGIPTTFPE